MRQMLLVQGVPLEIIMIQKTTYHVEEAIFPLPCWKCQNLEENIFFFGFDKNYFETLCMKV